MRIRLRDCPILLDKYSSGSGRRRGGALVMTVFAMFIVASATTGVLLVTANVLHTNSRQCANADAFNVAESGAEAAALWLKGQSGPPNYSGPWDPFGSPQILSGGNYKVVIYPDVNNSIRYLKTYRIVSTGTVGQCVKKVEVVVRQATFGRYAYFTDKETSSISGGAIWWKAGEVVDGPVHSNNSDGTNFNINYSGSNSPVFLDMVTGAGKTMNYSPSRPRNESTFKKIFKDGSKGYKLGVDPILLPESSDVQKDAAWGCHGAYPGTNGVYIRSDVNGGIYIQGDVGVKLSLDSTGNQRITITQGANTTTITLDKTADTTTVTGPVGSGSSSSTNSLGTGVIYCSGNITSLSGEVADNEIANGQVDTCSALTIATDVNADKYIRVTDNLTYHTKPDKTKDNDDPVNQAAGTLGLVAKDIRIASNAPKDLEIDAVCLAGGQNTTSGSFYVENYDSKTPVGTLTVLGGVIQKSRGPVGTFNSSTGQTMTGYGKNYRYDPRLATAPPPFYPTTGQYERLSWQVLPN